MGIRSTKTSAIILIVLFLGYYQRWLYVPIIEALSGRLSVDPAIPSLLENAELLAAAVKGQEDSEGVESVTGEGGGRGSSTLQTSNGKMKNIDPKFEQDAADLSKVIQRQLEVTHRAQNINVMLNGCRNPTIVCGAPIDCGLGCQIHYVMSCLMVAYSTNRTLIINWENWPYKETSWSDIFLPIGASECPITDDSATVVWTKTGMQLSVADMVTYPFKSGIPVPSDIGQRLQKLPTNQHLWWIGQFAKFVFRPQLAEQEIMNKLTKVMKFYLPTVGILVRKRDKLSEKKKTTQAIDRYMTLARKYFSRLEEVLPNLTRRVFIATDDRNVVKLVRKRYRPPKWEIVGFQLKSEVEDLAKDIYMLSECDYVICSFSTDICRLVLELKNSQSLNSSDGVKSLDQKYFFAATGFKKLRLMKP